MKERNVKEYADQGRKHIEEVRDVTALELDQLHDILTSGDPNAVYDCIETAIMFGFEVGYQQGKRGKI